MSERRPDIHAGGLAAVDHEWDIGFDKPLGDAEARTVPELDFDYRNIWLEIGEPVRGFLAAHHRGHGKSCLFEDHLDIHGNQRLVFEQ